MDKKRIPVVSSAVMVLKSVIAQNEDSNADKPQSEFFLATT